MEIQEAGWTPLCSRLRLLGERWIDTAAECKGLEIERSVESGGQEKEVIHWIEKFDKIGEESHFEITPRKKNASDLASH